jgi:acyl-CoA thioesterase-2
MFSGLAAVPGAPRSGGLTSIDHAVWFYRQVPLDDWVLIDLQPESTAGGRGIAQESLFRPGGTRPGSAR